jgi:CubicO group peptidase (beta-lactamase class C family)
MDDYITKARKEWMVPGLSIAIVKDDSVVFARGYGVREFGKTGKVDEHTVYSIASITKGFTSTALAMMVDEGPVNWDSPVRDYLPGFTLYDPFVSSEMRVRDLLCHRSGLATFSGDLVWLGTDYARDEVIRRARYLEPAHSFRYEFGYSNLMFLAAGEIIPAVSTVSWDDFLRHRILIPLGMKRTTVTPKEMFDKMIGDPNIAMPHNVDILDGNTRVIPYLDLENIAPAMGMNSSVSDLSQWIRFQLNSGDWNGQQLISQDALWETKKLHTSQSPELPMSNIWPSMHFSGYGLGWDLYDYHGWKIVAHEGGTDGMISRLVMVPDENFGFVILTNSISAITTGLEYWILDQFYQGKSYDWSSIFLESVKSYQKETKDSWKTYVQSADRSHEPSLELDKYCGIYGGELYGNVEVKLGEGRLILDFLPSNMLVGDLQTFSGDTFLIDLQDFPLLPQGVVKFFLDEEGIVKELEVDIPNPDFDFTELELIRITD